MEHCTFPDCLNTAKLEHGEAAAEPGSWKPWVVREHNSTGWELVCVIKHRPERWLVIITAQWQQLQGLKNKNKTPHLPRFATIKKK